MSMILFTALDAATISESLILEIVVLIILACVIAYFTPKLPQVAQWCVYGLIVLVAILIALSVLGLLR